MDTKAFYVLKTVCTVIVAVFGLLAAWFEFRDRWQTEEERTKTQKAYGGIWGIIRDTGILSLPEKVIDGCLKLPDVTSKILKNLGERISCRYHQAAALLLFCSIALGGSLIWDWPFAAGMVILLLWLMFSLYVGGALESKYKKYGKHLAMILLTPSALFLFITPIVGAVIWLRLLLSFPIRWAVIGMFVFVPVFGWAYWLAFGLFAPLFGRPRTQAEESFVGFAVIASFGVTMLSLLVGHLSVPSCWIPMTLRMLFANVICDGLTMYATLTILAACVEPKKILPIPTAITVDLLVAAMLACASLYFGLAGTENALTGRQVLRVFVALSPIENHHELGPYFWAMHTTFLPTAFYLCVLFLCWLGKLLVLPVAKILMKGEVVQKPHHLSAGACLLVVAIFVVTGQGIRLIEKQLSKKDSQPSSVVSPTESSDANAVEVESKVLIRPQRPKQD